MLARCLALACALCATVSSEVITATRLRVEYVYSPLGVDVTAPRFSYALVHPGRGQFQVCVY